MLIVPYKADLNHDRIPFITLLVMVLCLAIYTNQSMNEEKFVQASEDFCAEKSSVLFRLVLKNATGSSGQNACLETMVNAHLSDDQRQYIKDLVQKGKPLSGYTVAKGNAISEQVLWGRYQDYTDVTPAYETRQLWYMPESWDVPSMITAAFAHGSWLHVVGNLVFFFAFAVAVEMIIGSVRFIGVLLGLAIGTHIFYSLAMMGVDTPPPTVGLSGVVMGMLALFAYFLPHGRIRIFFWFIVFFRRFSIPAWFVAMWFVGWDVYSLVTDDGQSQINFVAHISGAALGYTAGLLLFRKQRERVAALSV